MSHLNQQQRDFLNPVRHFKGSVKIIHFRILVHHVFLHSLRSKRFRRVWEQRKTEERGFRYFACAENGARAKKRTVGVGEGKEGTACGQTPGF